MSKKFTDPFILPKTFYFYFFTTAFLVVQAIYFFFRPYKTRLSVTWLDAAVAVFYMFQLIRLATSSNTGFENDNFIALSLGVIMYFLIKPWLRNAERSEQPIHYLIYGLVLMGVGQSLYGFLQLGGVAHTLQNHFDVSGAFGNPGPYSNFLVALFPFAFSIILFRYQQDKRLYWLSGISFLFIVAILPFTKARAAWLAFLAGLCYMLYIRYGANRILTKWFRLKGLRIVLFTGIAVTVVLLGISLYKFKKESASGRLFVWKVSLQMIADKPLFGSGFGSFAAVHNNYQAKYFEENPGATKEAELADGVNYAFNEYLQIASDTGIIGLILFLSMLFLVFFKQKKQTDNSSGNHNFFVVAARTSVIAIAITSFFSYPLRTLPINAFFFFALAIVSANTSDQIKTIEIDAKARKLLSIAGMIALAVFFFNQKEKHDASKKWLHAYQLVREKRFDEAKQLYTELYPVLNYNPYFLFNYGAELSLMGEFSKSISILNQAESQLNDSDFYIYLGNSYAEQGKYQEAIQSFRKASLIMPVKFYPRYRMVKLYQQSNQKQEAINMAMKILSMEVKVPSRIVSGIKAEMQQFLEQEGTLKQTIINNE
jgi:O-antigen ligase